MVKKSQIGKFPIKKLIKENKRIQQIALLLLLLAGIQASIFFFIKDITFSREVGIVSVSLSAFSIICFLLFLIPSYKNLNIIDHKSNDVWKMWRTYQEGQINRFWLLYPGISCILIAMVNITYDAYTGNTTKLSGGLLISIAAIILIRNYYLNAYVQNREEANRVLEETSDMSVYS